MGGAYLLAFSERVADVPSYLKRHLALIRDLDEKVQALQKEIELHSKRKLAAKTSDGGGKRQKQSEPTYDVDSAVTRLLSLADEKVTIAAQVYDFIDKHIQHLDEDLKALTHEIEAEKQQGLGITGLGARSTAAAAGTNGAGATRGTKRGAAGASAGSSKGADGGAGKEGKGAKPKATKAGAAGKPRAGGGTRLAVEAAPPGAVDAPPVLLAHGPDEHEPLYCYCQRPSHGNMVACDNDECPLEWFHYECVGMTEPPVDQEWYCPDCAPLMSAHGGGRGPARPAQAKVASRGTARHT